MYKRQAQKSSTPVYCKPPTNKSQFRNAAFCGASIHTVPQIRLRYPYAAQRFIDNLPAIFAGTFNHALLEDASECSDLLKLYKNVAVKPVSYTHLDVYKRQDDGLSTDDATHRNFGAGGRITAGVR